MSINRKSITSAQIIIILFLSIVFITVHCNNNNNDKKVTKLQIGIKKRVDDCQRRASKGDILHIHYRGTLHSTGAEFDSSYKRGTPLKFTLGAGQVIAGWDQGMLGICVGEKRKLVIPSDLAYGSTGSPPTIPPDSSLIFEVECIQIENRKSDL
nr:peptidyl-prolyl cis-trans isomerase FKBP2-like [Dermatophagoides farinae]